LEQKQIERIKLFQKLAQFVFVPRWFSVRS